jgi:hypothetical protein
VIGVRDCQLDLVIQLSLPKLPVAGRPSQAGGNDPCDHEHSHGQRAAEKQPRLIAARELTKAIKC